MARTFSGIFERIVQFDSLYRAYTKTRKGKRETLVVMRFERNLESEIIQLQNELIWGAYVPGGYRTFYVEEPKRRKITALKRFRDRVLQQAIHSEIEPIWEARFIADSYACRPGKGTHAGANRAQAMLRECLARHGALYALKADISRYFASIDHGVLKGLIRKRICDARLLRILDDTIDSYCEPDRPGKGIPIGSLTSQLFANIYLDHLDQWMKCRKLEKWYVRYMDDFVVIHPDKRHLHALRIDLDRFLANELMLETNHKTGVFPVAHKSGRGLDFLGYHIWPDRRRLRKASLKRFKRRVRRTQRHYSQGRISIPEAREQFQSWLAHARHGNATPAVEKFLSTVTFKREDDGPDHRRSQ